jgi:hypothetical protein
MDKSVINYINCSFDIQVSVHRIMNQQKKNQQDASCPGCVGTPTQPGQLPVTT